MTHSLVANVHLLQYVDFTQQVWNTANEATNRHERKRRLFGRMSWSLKHMRMFAAIDLLSILYAKI